MLAVEKLFLKTRPLRSFQTSQDTNIARDANALRFSLFLLIATLHHSLTLVMLFHPLGSRSERPSQSFKLIQILTVKRHLNNRCAADSWAWLQSLQSPQFCNPLLSSLSVVQTLFCRISHAKILHFGGAHGFQTKVGIKDEVWPKNCIMYADLAEYSLLLVSFQAIVSEEFGSRWTSWSISHRFVNSTMCWVEMPSCMLIWVIQKSSNKALATVVFFFLEMSKIRGATSLGLKPLSQEESQKIAFFPLPIVTLVAAEKRSLSRGVQVASITPV